MIKTNDFYFADHFEPLPVKRTVKKYKVFPVSSRSLLAAFYAAR